MDNKKGITDTAKRRRTEKGKIKKDRGRAGRTWDGEAMGTVGMQGVC